MIDQVIILVIIAFATYGFFLFSYQLWCCVLGLFYKNHKRNLLALKLYKETLKQNDFPALFINDNFTVMVVRKESKK